MTDFVVALIPTYGPAALAVLIAFACLGFPVPASLGLITAGGLVAASDMDLPSVLILSFIGAVVGDHTGYFLGKSSSNWLARKMKGTPAREKAHEKAVAGLRRWGGIMVFFSRWMITPPGPAINYLAGASKLNLMIFSFAVIAGEMVWVLLYVATGYLLSTRIASFLPVVTDAGWLAVVSGVLLALLFRLWRKMRISPSNPS